MRSAQCSPHDLSKAEQYTQIFVGMLSHIFGEFNVRESAGQWWDGWRKNVADRVR